MGYAAISMGLFVFIFAYFTFNAPSTPKPTEKPKTDQISELCQTEDPAVAPTFQAPADDVSKVGWDDQDRESGTLVRDPEGCGGDRHNFRRGNVTYRLIRKNVPMSTTDVKKHDYNWDDSSCHFDSAEKLGFEIPEIDRSRFKIFFPEISGEISLDRLLESRTRGGERDLMYFIDYGLVFLLHVNPDGGFTELKGGTTGGQSETFYLVDIYQDIDSGRPDLPPEAFACDATKGAQAISGTQVIQPAQSISEDPDQLQLQYFVFGTGASSNKVVNGWGVHCKPAVYLYPPQKQLVNVKIYPSGFLTYVDPPYDNEKGWVVEAYPDGRLFGLDHNSIPANYLYFESKIRDEVIRKPQKGWVVKYADLEKLYKEILPKLGLNATQEKDFIGYWTKALSKDPSAYYFVGIIDQSNVDEIEKLEITPKPDFINRVRFYFERLDAPKTVEAPDLTGNLGTADNSQFRVVEWGGMVKNDPDHPFTCSQ